MTDSKLDEYIEFVNSILSDSSKDVGVFLKHFHKLQNSISAPTLLLGGMGTSSEAGEMLDIIKKIYFHEKEIDAEIINKLIHEAGDVVFYLNVLCLALKIPFDTLINENTKKLKARFPEGKFTSDHKK